MSNDTPLADGIIFKQPHASAPSWCIGKLSVKINDFIPFMQTHNNNNWINLEICISKAGKPYIKLDTWKPEQQQQQQGYQQPQQKPAPPPPPAPFPTDNPSYRAPDDNRPFPGEGTPTDGGDNMDHFGTDPMDEIPFA